MFETDDFDQVLSQFEFPEDVMTDKITEGEGSDKHAIANSNVERQNKSSVQSINENIALEIPGKIRNDSNNIDKNVNEDNIANNVVSPKNTKRKIINSYFNHKTKRKFPGPAGLLTGGFEENKNESICQIELLSQDVDFTQNSLRGELFDSPLWARLQEDLRSWNLHDIDSIKSVKQQAISGNLKRRKAHTITAFVEAVDRSATDPLIIMRDTTGKIKGTLHRDAWSTFSKYIASEYCAFILWKPTILTTGSAFKKHYLNITLSNILAIYSSTVLANDADTSPLPDGYSIVYEDTYTVIKTQNNLNNIDADVSIPNNVLDSNAGALLEDLDTFFFDDVF